MIIGKHTTLSANFTNEEINALNKVSEIFEDIRTFMFYNSIRYISINGNEYDNDDINALTDTLNALATNEEKIIGD
jgi:hypothetical protein